MKNENCLKRCGGEALENPEMNYILSSIYKKSRRSPRLQHRERHEQTNKSINEGPLGYLGLLPPELKFLLFSYLSVEELSVLTIASKTMRNAVELYKNSEWAQKYILPKWLPLTHASFPVGLQTEQTEQFRKLGLLMKRSTCLYATKDRLKLALQFLQKYQCNYHNVCDDPSSCVALMCCGKFLSTMIAGWDDKECMKTFETIGRTTVMTKHLTKILNSKPGVYPQTELHVRLYYRRIFIRQTENTAERAFWLNQILKPYPMVHQARILYLLFGPVCGAEVQWFDMCENIPGSKDQAMISCGDLATAFKILHMYSKDWTEDAIISVIDELTNSPEDWLVENVANLLYLCGDSITLKVLNSKAINGRISELANIITSLCLVCTKQGQKMSWLLDIIKGVCQVIENTKDRRLLITTILDMFKEIILDIHEFEDDSGQDLLNILDAQGQFMLELCLMAFKPLVS